MIATIYRIRVDGHLVIVDGGGALQNLVHLVEHAGPSNQLGLKNDDKLTSDINIRQDQSHHYNNG